MKVKFKSKVPDYEALFEEESIKGKKSGISILKKLYGQN